MGDRFGQLEDKHIAFIQQQHIFFVGTAAKEGLVNVSPKGTDSFRVIDNKKVVWLNLTGSGNETAAHLLDTNRMTIMFCSFDKQPLILRLYGKANTIHQQDDGWHHFSKMFPSNVGARQFFEMDIEMVLTSCGFGVPYYELIGERPTLNQWADNRGREGVEAYWEKENVLSLDNKETGILST